MTVKSGHTGTHNLDILITGVLASMLSCLIAITVAKSLQPMNLW